MNYSRAELVALRIECDKSLLFFTRLFYKYLRGEKFKVAKHHYIICGDLESVEHYKTTFYNCNIPPRHSKTELILNFIARGIGKNPKGNYFYITGSDELRAETSVRIRDIVSSDLFYLLYGVRLKKDQKSRNLWRTEHGGGLKTATISGQITGFGAGLMSDHMSIDQLVDELRAFEGCVCMDDLNKMDDSEKDNANNDKINRLLTNTVISRVNSEDTPFINIQQRAGENDATATLLEVFTALLPEDKIINRVLPVIYEGQPLWPEKMSMQRIEKQRTNPKTAHSFATQFMQEPTSPNDRPFHKTKLKFFSKSELDHIRQQSEGVVSYIDCKDEGNDYYCHVLAHVIGEAFYVTDVIHNKFNTDITVPKSIELIKNTGCSHTVIETNAMGSMVLKLVRSSVSSRVVGIPSTTKKATRISMQEATIQGRFRFMSDPDLNSEYENYMRILTKFEYGETTIDDAPDATAGLSHLCQVKFPHLFK